MELEPLIGKRTWPRHTLVDGTETTQPEYSSWFKDVGWGKAKPVSLLDRNVYRYDPVTFAVDNVYNVSPIDR